MTAEAWAIDRQEVDMFSPASGHYTVPAAHLSVYIGGVAPNADWVDIHGPNQEAHAHLIATAPELLGTLDDALILLEGWINRYCNRRYRAEHLADLAAKRSVIDKALGRPTPPSDAPTEGKK